MDFKTTYDFHGDGLSKIVRELMLFRKLPRAFIPDLMVRIEPGGGYVYVAEQTGGKVWPEGSSVFFFLCNLSPIKLRVLTTDFGDERYAVENVSDDLKPAKSVDHRRL